MIDLSKHIEILLLKHDCVIVPNLGGFIAQNMPAQFVAEENIFLPPHRTVGFNPELTLNDGLLAQSYMQAYNTTYSETLHLIEQTVNHLKEEIQQKGKFYINGIGTISIGVDGLYNFQPYGAGIISPNLYGLDAVSIKKEVTSQTNKPTTETTIVSQNKTQQNNNPKNYTFSINKELVNYVAAAVVAIFFYFIWATPIAENTNLSAQQASILFPHSIQHVKKEMQQITSNIPDTIIIDEKDKTITKENVDKDYIKVDSQQYTIVLASCIPMKNAESYVQQLKKRGLENVSISQTKNIIRVVYNSYDTEASAYADLSLLKKAHKDFKDAWIHKNQKNNQSL